MNDDDRGCRYFAPSMVPRATQTQVTIGASQSGGVRLVVESRT